MTAMTYTGTVSNRHDLELEHVGEEDMIHLHEWLSSILLGCGLEGDLLDEAIAGALRAILPLLERERSRIRPVGLRVV
jgi:hypothetical protein